MKAKIVITAFLSLLILSSCNYFKNHRLFSKDADTVLDMTIEQPESLGEDTSDYMTEEYIEPVIDAEPIPVSETGYSSSNDKYFMVVASFQNQNLAKQSFVAPVKLYYDWCEMRRAMCRIPAVSPPIRSVKRKRSTCTHAGSDSVTQFSFPPSWASQEDALGLPSHHPVIPFAGHLRIAQQLSARLAESHLCG